MIPGDKGKPNNIWLAKNCATFLAASSPPSAGGSHGVTSRSRAIAPYGLFVSDYCITLLRIVDPFLQCRKSNTQIIGQYARVTDHYSETDVTHRVGILFFKHVLFQFSFRPSSVSMVRNQTVTRPKYGLTVTVPDAPDPALVYRIIYEELVARKITEKLRTTYREVIAHLIDAGVEAIILGYTEIMLKHDFTIF